MNRFNVILCLAALLLVQSSASAQLLNIRLGSDVLVENAVKDAVVLVESSYCIQDVKTNQKYGRNGKSYFNKLQFLGCKTDKGIITVGSAVEPWTADKIFDKYRKESKYRPLLDSTLVVRSLPADTTLNVSIASGLTYNNDSTLVRTGAGGSSTDGLMTSVDSTEAVNWLVWIRKAADTDSGNAPGIEYAIVKKSIDLHTGGAEVDAPTSTTPFLGGLYVSARIVSVGLVEFSLTGFVVNKSGKWIVEPAYTDVFALPTDSGDKEECTPDSDNPDDDLTPVKEDGKKKKKKSKASKKK